MQWPRFTPEFRRNFPWSLAWYNRALWGGLWYYGYYLGWIWPFMFTAGAVFFTNFTPWWNVLDWRSFNQLNANMQWLHQFDPLGDYSNHHFLNLMAEAGACFFLAFFFARKLHQPVWKQGIMATYGAVLIWSVHEGYWWIVYYGLWEHFNIGWIDHLSGFGEMLTLGLLIFTPILGLYGPKRYLLAMGGFYLLWVAVGFPITESYRGITQWYGTLWGNGWEVGSWIYAAVAFCFLEKDGLLKWYQRMDELVNKSLSKSQMR